MSRYQPQAFAVHATVVREGLVRVRAEGEIDILSASLLEAALRVELDHGCDVLLDLSAVSFIDSTGLHAVVSAARAARSCGHELTLHSAMGRQTRKLLEVTKLERTLVVAG